MSKEIDYSIIIPAYNEEEWLEDTLSSLLSSIDKIPEKGEVIVVDNNSTDRTAAIAEEMGVKVIFEPVNQIARARNAGAKASKGRNLIFLDADSKAPLVVLSRALELLKSGRCCGGGALLVFDDESPKFGNTIANIFGIIQRKAKIAAGSFVFCSKTAFDSIGGFNERVFASEEIWFSRDLKRFGRERNMRFEVITEERIITSGRKLKTPLHIISVIFLGLVFPFMIFFRPLCWLWYRRRPRT